MKAAVLNAFASPLAIETVADPVLGTGEVIVDVAASRVLAYANEVLSGERKYLLELPVVFGSRRDRPYPRHRTRCDAASRRRLGLLRSDRALARQCALARHRAAGPDRRQRSRPAPATLLPRRRMGRTDAAADGKRHADRRHRRRGCRAMVRAGHAAGALWRVPRRRAAGRRNRARQRRDRQFRQRRRRGRAGHGRAMRHSHRAEREGACRTDRAVRHARPNRANARSDRTAARRSRRPRPHFAGGALPHRLRPRYPAARGQTRHRCGPPSWRCGRTGAWC